MEIASPQFGSAMSNLCEDKALDIIEEENFKMWLAEQGITPTPAVEAVRLRELFETWCESGGREAS